MKKEFEYDLFYDGDMYCMSFSNLEKAIKHTKQTVKYNPKCKGGYSLKLYGIVIWTY